MTPRRNRRAHSGTGSPSTIKALVTPSRQSHAANFKRILPSAMAKLVEQGLFEPCSDEEGGYRITAKGRAILDDLPPFPMPASGVISP